MVYGVRGLAAAAAVLAASATGAVAQDEPVGQPVPWGMGLQRVVTEIGAQKSWFNDYTLVIITVITLFVLGLLIWVGVFYRASKNPNPSKTTHNTMLEVVWTVVPVLILVAIAFPSFRLLYNQTTIPEPDITVKATGAQWYWIYEYMDEDMQDMPSMTSYPLDDEQRAARMDEHGLSETDVPRLLAVDYPLVVPAGATVHLVTTGMDVTHAVAVPAFGIKADSWPGRLNETWFQTDTPGVYYGQCSQLCGRLHYYMPLEVRVLEQERFDEWVALAREDLDEATAQLLEWQAGEDEANVALAR